MNNQTIKYGSAEWQGQEEEKRQALIAWIRRNAEEAVWLPQVQAGKK